jgi:hypothetical protein
VEKLQVHNLRSSIVSSIPSIPSIPHACKDTWEAHRHSEPLAPGHGNLTIMADKVAAELHRLDEAQLRELVLVLCMDNKNKQVSKSHIATMKAAVRQKVRTNVL